MITCLLIAASASAGAQDGSRLREGFLNIAAIQSVTGFENELRDYLIEQLPQKGIVKTDNMGNVIVSIGEGEPETLLLASLDEPGYVISEITGDGYMRVQPASRSQSPLFNQFHEGHLVDIITETGGVRGIVSIPSSHITRNKPPVIPLEEFFIDVGAKSKSDVAALGIKLLDPFAAVKDFAILRSNRVAGPMLSRKFPAFALLEVLRTAASGTDKPVAFAWTTLSANRNSGVMRLAQELNPKSIIAITSFKQQTNRRTGTTIVPVSGLDSGVLIPQAPQSGGGNNAAYQSVLAAAAENNIKITASPAGSLRETRYFRSVGQNIVPLAIPVKYPESLVEVIDLDDLQQLITLVELLLK